MKLNVMLVFLILTITACYTESHGAESSIKAGGVDGMFRLYEENREKGIGNYITLDFVLTAYGLLLNDSLTSIEEQLLFPAFVQLVKGATDKIESANEQAPGRRMALGYLAVLGRLLDQNSRLPDEVAERCEAELKMIEAHKGLEHSAVTGAEEDFSQYLPRGKYAASASLRKYFLAMAYAGRAGFYVKESGATGITAAMADEHTAAALLLCRTINDDDHLKGLYKRVNHLLDFFVGKSDDLTLGEYLKSASDLPPAEARKKILEDAKSSGRMPKIVSAAPDKSRLEPGVKIEEALLSFKLFGQRYTPDSDALQLLTFDRVTDYRGKGAPFTLALINGRRVRGVPSVLDIMAGLGSGGSKKILRRRGDVEYKSYDRQFSQASALLARMIHDYPPSLPGNNLRIVKSLLDVDTGERINAAVGFWVRNRHTTVLYAKQSYTAVQKSLGNIPLQRVHAAIEFSPDLYDKMVEGLFQVSEVVMGKGRETSSLQQSERGDLEGKISQFRDALMRLRAIGHKQQKAGLERVDCEYLNGLDRVFAGLLSGTDHPIVVDIHTEPNSRIVVEEGIGYPLIVQKGECRGGRFTCYEFKQPMDQRLTDEAWQDMLRNGKASGSLTPALLHGSP